RRGRMGGGSGHVAGPSLGAGPTRGPAVTEAELLQRIARTLRQDIGPAVRAEYPRTQAFMAAVVLQKVSRQLALADEHAAAEIADLTALLADLRQLSLDDSAPSPVLAAVDGLAQALDAAALCRLIEALYGARADLGEARFATLLGRIRQTLRRNIDRRMAVAE